MSNLFSNLNWQYPNWFKFEQYADLKSNWEVYKRNKVDRNVTLIVSDNVSTLGYWLVPNNYVFADFDKLFRGKEVDKLISAIDYELSLNPKIKRMFMIKSKHYDGAIVSTCGLITGYSEEYKFMFGQTLNQIKPFLKQQKELNLRELDIIHSTDYKRQLFDR